MFNRVENKTSYVEEPKLKIKLQKLKTKGIPLPLRFKNLPPNILVIHQTKVLTTPLYLVRVKNVVLLLYQFSELK